MNGVWSAMRATAASTYETDGFVGTNGGSSRTATLNLSGTSALAAHVRYARTSTTSTVAYWSGNSSSYLFNTVRGFTAKWLFGTPEWTVGHLFAGFCAASPSGSGQFSGWASSRALGVTVNKNDNKVYWAWRTDASTYGTTDSTLTWANDEVWSLSLVATAAATSVSATLASSGGQSATHTFAAGEFPDGSTDASALLTPVVRGQPDASDRVTINAISWWCTEPW